MSAAVLSWPLRRPAPPVWARRPDVPDARMTRLGRAELGTGEFTDLDTALERVDRVTTDDVLELARDLLTRPKITSVVGDVERSALESAIGVGGR